VIPDGGGAEGERALDVALGLCKELGAHGLETLLDDRDVRPGVKFKDADLIGLPLRITVGRSLADDAVEFRLRAGSEVALVPVAAAAAKAAEILGAAPHGRHATDVGPDEGAAAGHGSGAIPPGCPV
jgi:prolyl-tRNA synthetase